MTIEPSALGESNLVVDRSGHVTTLTINRPDAFNALNADVLDALESAVATAQTDSRTRAIIITGAGEKAFSAGADLKELAAMDADQALATMQRGQEVFRHIERSDVPVIAAVNGLALGGGFELILASTFSVVSQNAALGLPESSLGLIPGYGGTQRLARIVGKPVAAYLMLTGARLDAERVHALGISPLPPVAPEELLDFAQDVAAIIAAQGPKAVRAILQAMDIGRDATIEAGLAHETGMAALAIAGDESTEGIGAFLERRKANFGQSQENNDA